MESNREAFDLATLWHYGDTMVTLTGDSQQRMLECIVVRPACFPGRLSLAQRQSVSRIKTIVRREKL